MWPQGKSQGTFGGFTFGTPAGQTSTSQVPTSSAPSGGFSFPAAKPQSGASTFHFSTPAPTTGSSGGFAFGATQSTPAASGFNFGATSQQPASNASGGIKFGLSAGGTSTGGLQFSSTPSTLTQGAFSMSTPAVGSAGIKTATVAAASTSAGFSFGSVGGNAPSGGFTLGTTTTATGTPLLTSLLGSTPAGSAPAPATATTTGLMFGAAASAATQAPISSVGTQAFNVGGTAKTPGLTLGGGLAAKPSGLSAAATVPTTKTTSGGFTFGPTGGMSSAGGVTLGKSSVATTSATPSLGFSLNQTPVATISTATTTAVGLVLGPIKPPSTLTSTTSVGIKLGPTLTTTSLTSTTTTTTAGLLGRTINTSTTSTTAGPVSTAAPQMTYKQVEDHINKWAQELEEYEKTFLEQASQVNNWDRLLMENGEKITELNSNVETVKAEQKRLDQELDFIMSQQRDLEDMLTPLEESLKNASHVTGYEQHADHEREKTYKLAADIDGQLKQMVQDLKSIIDHLNLTSGTQTEGDDPIVQIAKILNAHTNSLQWIDQNSALLQRKVDEVSRLSEARRKEQERNFRLAFE